MTFYRRNLPHWHPEGRELFLTWRLHGSLPAGYQQKPKQNGLPGASAGRAFLGTDRALDRAAAGPVWLKDPSIARCVVDALNYGQNELKLYELSAYVIMPNHLHLLLRPHAPLARITNVLKGYTARMANQILGRTGKAFWQDESFDRWVRDAADSQRIVRYIEWNPVSAGLVDRPENWAWSSAALDLECTGKNACAT